MTEITSEQAQRAIDAAITKSKELNCKMDIAVVDAGANLKAFHRMDGAWLGSIDIAMKKAKTARFFDMDTDIIGSISQPGGELFNIEVSNGGLITFGGGCPIKCGEVIIGAIGVSGSSVPNDILVAKAGRDGVSQCSPPKVPPKTSPKPSPKTSSKKSPEATQKNTSKTCDII